MTLYADALAIVSNRMDQIPSKDSMPGSLYSDLALLYQPGTALARGTEKSGAESLPRRTSAHYRAQAARPVS